MSSPPEGKLETKAGHPPAVKAGGMRIVQKHPHTGDTKEEKDKDDQEWESPRMLGKEEADQSDAHRTPRCCTESYFGVKKGTAFFQECRSSPRVKGRRST
ncbi:death-associated protein 1 isoform X3 [Papio anubis]|uniref:death-associated protein 1 isoform X3 n=1 Tax=Papio anubis TaxID=9555 RepID=UPI000B7B7212|nr:death-associated protein 1 isoform X3 [Papio anubis]